MLCHLVVSATSDKDIGGKMVTKEGSSISEDLEAKSNY